MKAKDYNRLFDRVITDYHRKNTVDPVFENPFNVSESLLDHLLYKKCWIDTVQWHYEDLIRCPNIEPVAALELKRKIDASNQERTDMVEYIDAYFLKQYQEVKPQEQARMNTESPAWAIDRLSILALKIYHMQEESVRPTASASHHRSCSQKLAILLQQRKDLSLAIDQLLTAIAKGEKYMKVYKQMKMYNDERLNPILYGH